MSIDTAGVVLNNLAPGSVIDVETRSRHYHIECLGGNAIRVSGHPEYCPEPTPAHLQGAVDPAGVVEEGRISSGKRLMFFLDESFPVTTSKVVSIHVDRPHSTSIH
jgi:hypothetical protein